MIVVPAAAAEVNHTQAKQDRTILFVTHKGKTQGFEHRVKTKAKEIKPRGAGTQLHGGFSSTGSAN